LGFHCRRKGEKNPLPAIVFPGMIRRAWGKETAIIDEKRLGFFHEIVAEEKISAETKTLQCKRSRIANLRQRKGD